MMEKNNKEDLSTCLSRNFIKTKIAIISNF